MCQSRPIVPMPPLGSPPHAPVAITSPRTLICCATAYSIPAPIPYDGVFATQPPPAVA